MTGIRRVRLAVMWVGLLAVMAAPLSSQGPTTQSAATNERPIGFDVVSVRPSGTGLGGFGMKPDGFFTKGEPLWTAIMFAYFPMTKMMGQTGGQWLLGVPDWVNKEKYDIDAKVDAATAERWKNMTVTQRMESVRPMLQAMLAERCHLVVHREMQDVAVFALTAGKGGLKLKQVQPGEPKPDHAVQLTDGAWMVPFMTRRHSGDPPRQLAFFNISMEELATQLTNFDSTRPIVDRTGLKGRYSFSMPEIVNDGPESDPDLPSMMDVGAIGLKLEPAKAPMEKVVIDHVERPTEN